MRTIKKLFVFLFGLITLLLSGCQIPKYDINDAEEYANNNLDINVVSIFCTGEIGFQGSQRYDLIRDEREVCFILGENQNLEYVYSYGSSENTKLILNEPSVLSSDVILHLEENEIEIKFWKFIYLDEIDSLVYFITTDKYSEYYLCSRNDEYKYYTYSTESILINLSLQELIEFESTTG